MAIATELWQFIKGFELKFGDSSFSKLSKDWSGFSSKKTWSQKL